MPTAFITGITGQDGSYLAELLLAKGYEVHGLVHRPESLPQSSIAHLYRNSEIMNRRLFLHYGACEDAVAVRRILMECQPSEVYHLAAQSSPQLSLQTPERSVEVIGMASLHMLEVVRDLPDMPRLLFASSAEIFGTPTMAPQNEQTPVAPTTPYGAAKALAYHLINIYRSVHGLPITSLILYSHESPRRGEIFVTRKITRAATRIKMGLQERLTLGSLDGRRDWGYAPEYVELMWQALQTNRPGDYVISTGTSHTVGDFVRMTFAHLGMDWRDHVDYDPTLTRTVDSPDMVGDHSLARDVFGWKPQVTLGQLVGIMTDADLKLARLEASAKE